MAYNNKNLLKRKIELQEIYQRYKKQGATTRWIFTNIIEPKFKISRRTMDNWLSTPARRDLRSQAPDELEQLIEKMKNP